MHDTHTESWLRYTSHDYTANVDKWNYVSDHLDGTVIDEGKIKKYLKRRKQGESEDAYEERKNIVDYTPHFARATLTLAGMLWSVEYDARRKWAKEEGGEGLGSPQEEGTIMSQLWMDADGRGANWPTIWKGATIDAIAYQRFYVLVDGVIRDDTGSVVAEPSVRIIPPQSVTRTIYDSNGRLISAKVKTSTETVRSQRQPAEKETRYLIYDLEGVETWREDEDKEPEQVGPKRYYGGENRDFRYLARDLRTPILPLFEERIPLRANLGYIMAKKANAIFNQENTLDFLLWISCFPKLFLDVQSRDGTYNKDMYDQLTSDLMKGKNALPGKGNKYDAPPTAPAEIKQKILVNKVKAFFTTFFQAYGDAASERTATEIRQDFRAGVEAFLTLLGTAMDEAENATFWRLEQVYFPNNRELWGGSFVERSTEFQPVDIEDRIDKLIARYLPSGKVPTDVDTALDVAIKALEADGIPVNAERKANLREKMEEVLMREDMAGSLGDAFGISNMAA